MSKLAEHFEHNDKQNRMINLEQSGSRINKIIELETPGHKKKNKIKRIEIKETMRNGLDELKISKMNNKKELEKMKLNIMSLKENERIVRFKIEEKRIRHRIKRTKIKTRASTKI